MEINNLEGYTRDPNVFKKYFKVVDNLTINTENLYVYIPKSFLDLGICLLGDNISTVGFYFIVDEYKHYSVVIAPIMMVLQHDNVTTVTIGGTEYLQLDFYKGGVFLATNTLVVSDSLIYPAFKEFFIQGKIPFFLNYQDVSNLFLEVKKYANSKIANNPVMLEILASIVARSREDNKVFIREIITPTNMDNLNITYIGLNNVFYSYNNTGAKLIGNYFSDGLNAAIIEPEDITTTQTELLRS